MHGAHAAGIDAELLASADNMKLCNRRAAFGLGALLKMAFGPTISGVPSLG